ncbi:hypothetical protein IAT40_003347 [Kwoniella sp. CBS 6097]
MDIPFESFAKLVYRLGNPPRKQAHNSAGDKPGLSPSKIFQSWLDHLPKPFPPHTGKHLFRLLFPHEGSRRRYGLKEAKLALELERVLGVKGLTRWDSVCWDAGGEGGTGCLGREVELLLRDRGTCSSKATLSIREVDNLLDKLASSSPFSQLSQTPIPLRQTSVILTDLYRTSNLSPYALAVLTQVILRDLRPLLNPLPNLPIRNPTAMLRMKSTAGPDQLTVRDAMICWDKRMWDLYVGGRGNLDKCVDLVEGQAGADAKHEADVKVTPVIGVNVKIPKCKKGRSIADALGEFTGTSRAPPASEIWAETKYDGYRMQIHVYASCANMNPKISVFSKSMRDSTQDRINTHSIILSALDLPVGQHLPAHPALREGTAAPFIRRRRITSVILEAEVVSYNESSRDGGRGPGVEEFWWLGLAGVTANPLIRDFPGSAMPRNRSRHLCLVFFDILLVDSQSLLNRAYEARRAILEEVIRPIPGFAMLAERTRIPLGLNRHAAIEALGEAFQRSTTRREEGLVLKASESTYTNMRWQWVKLKKDYIPNLGDCIDLVLLGAGWDIDRARELRVDTSVFTTFYIGVLTNAERVKTKRETPNFEVLFRASYGLDRSALEVYNENIRHGRWASKSFDKDDPFKRRLLGLSWTYTMPRGMTPPSVLFQSPLCAEVMGAGFQKLPSSEMYELRWPRLQKIYDPSERSWIHALSSIELLQIAHKSLGYTSPLVLSPKSPDDSINALWRSSSTLALIDIPELVSPISSSSSKEAQGRGSPMKRVRSAPELELEPELESDVKDEYLSPDGMDGGIGAFSGFGRVSPKERLAPSGKRRRLTRKAISFGDAGKKLKEIMGLDRPLNPRRSPSFTTGFGSKQAEDGVSGPAGEKPNPSTQSHLLTQIRDDLITRDRSHPGPKYILQPAFVPCTPMASSTPTPSSATGIPLERDTDRRQSLDITPRPKRRICSNLGGNKSSPSKKLISSIDWSLADLTDSTTITTATATISPTTAIRSSLFMRKPGPGMISAVTSKGTARSMSVAADMTHRTEKHRPLSLRSRLKMLARRTETTRHNTESPDARMQTTMRADSEGSLESLPVVQVMS